MPFGHPVPPSSSSSFTEPLLADKEVSAHTLVYGHRLTNTCTEVIGVRDVTHVDVSALPESDVESEGRCTAHEDTDVAAIER